ncbi:MAG: hypothetical protein HONBIEJF_01253 [Fimbriimonadaceae bacterium]|nr:hypothetical protein [Fimbriimonadaceae bacterium]
MKSRRRRGITLIEALLALGIGGILVTAVTASFRAVVDYQANVPPKRDAALKQISFEDRLRNLLARAFVDEDQANPNTYFIGQNDPEAASSLGSGEAATELIFTVLGKELPGAAAASSGDTFEDRNAEIGPVGGISEIRLGVASIGDPGAATGLFVREQIPADEDPNQGGYESVFDERVTSISFEFWDGTDWLPEWTTQLGERRLPAAVRITYALIDDEEGATRSMIIRLNNSDVTTVDPAGGQT